MARRGRNRKSGAKRKPNGQIAYNEDPRQTGVDARMRQKGISKKRALQRESGFPIGDLLQSDNISQTQFDALECVGIAKEDYQMAMLVKRMRSASDFSISPGFDNSDGTEPEYMEFYDRAIARWDAIEQALFDAESVDAYDAVQMWVIAEIPVWELLGDLRIGANAVARMLKKGK